MEKIPHDLSIQAGCHDENLVDQPGQWKRWPMTVWITPLFQRVRYISGVRLVGSFT
jgi:hypothetical protein